MSLKTWLEDAIDPRPIPHATTYAVGTCLQGVALGLLLAAQFGSPLPAGLWAVVAVAGALGVGIAVSAYGFLKRHCNIVVHGPAAR